MTNETKQALTEASAKYEDLTPEHKAYVDGVIAGLTMATKIIPAPAPVN